MKWKPTNRKTRKSSQLEWVTYVLGRLEKFFVRSILSTPVLSSKEKEDIVQQYRDIRQVCVEGVARTKSAQPSCDHVNEHVSSADFAMDDVELSVKYSRTNDDLLYFVSLSLSVLERLYLTNRMSESLYTKYKQLLRFLPNLQYRLEQYMTSR